MSIDIKFPPRLHEIVVGLNERERMALDALCREKDMTPSGVMRHALRYYQLIHLRLAAGETMRFSGDAERDRERMVQSESSGTDKGPWDVREHEGEVFVDSDDFTHDVCLIVRGDLGDIEKKKAYAAKIAEILNWHGPFKFADYGSDEKAE